MQKLSLLVQYADKNRMPEEPMGDFFEFETIEDFIQFNREELAIASEFYPKSADEFKRIEQKLLDRDFVIEPYTEDSSFVIVTNV